MSREEALHFLNALKRGDKKAIAEIMGHLAAQRRVMCGQCQESVPPILRGYDFEELAMRIECPVCGKSQSLALQEWDGKGPQWPRSHREL